MAKKNIQVVYTVNDAALLKSAAALRANEEAAKKADNAVSKFGKSGKKSGDDVSKSFLNLNNIWKGLVAIGITTFFVNLVKKTFELGVKQEQLNIAFTTFLGSAEKAKKLLQDLTKFAIVTPFTPDQVNNAAKALLAFGVAGKDIIPTLKMLGDVSSGTGKDLTEMAIIFGQIRSTGRLMGQDLLQLINAGFNPLQIISEQTGKSVGRLKAEMEKGLITFDMVAEAFKSATSEGGRFFNLMEKQSQSVGGLLSTIEGNIDEILKNLFTATSGPVKDFVDQLVKLSEGFLQLSLSADQAKEKLNAGIRENFKKTFEEFAKGTEGVAEASRIMATAIIQQIDALEAQHAAALKSGKDTEEEQKSRLALLNVKRQELIALVEYGDAIKEANEAEESKKLATQLEKELVAREALLKARKKFIADLLNDPIVEQDAPTPLEGDAFGFLPEGWREFLEADTQAALDIIKDTDDKILQSHVDTETARTKATDEEEKKRRELRQQAFDYGIDLLQQLLMASIDASDQTFKREKGNFDQRLAVAGDNERARMEIMAEREKFELAQDAKAEQFEKERAKRRKEQQVKEMIIQNVSNALRALGTPPVPNFPLAAITSLFGLAQIGVAKAIGFKEGVIDLKGPGTSTSDSIPARLSRGESVINAESTSRSMNLLEAINDGKIDDRILRRLKVGANGVTVINKYDDLKESINNLRVDHHQYGHFVIDTVRKGKNLKQHTISKHRHT